jgi:thiol:disulfide interchange protein
VARAAAGASPAILSNTQDIKSEDEFQRLFSNFVAAKQINAARTNAAQLQKQAEGQALRINPPSRRYVVMTVHAPWCGHCKRLVPVWRSVLDPSKLDAAGVTALDWDSDAVPKEVNQAVLRRYNVRGYPTVLKLDAATGDVVDEYKGGPDAQALQAFLYGGK